MNPNLMHALSRTSPKGGPFIGTCMKCGKTGLTLEQVRREECQNPAGMSGEEVLRHAILGDKEL